MKSVWKYELPVDDTVQLRIPEGSELLHVATQNETPCLWFRVDTEAKKQLCTYHVRGTGHDCDGLGKHLGSVLLRGGRLVFHIFESGAQG